MFQQERIYIAGPECFYKNGFALLNAMKCYAQSQGFAVTLPNDHPLDMENEDLRKRADSIFRDLKTIMKETTVIIADLEAFRGAEADSGTVYEIGMAYADGLKCYGYTRDKRALAWKDQGYCLKDGVIFDADGNKAPYAELPFSPAVVGSTKIVEGDFYDCLEVLKTDMEEEWKRKGRKPGEIKEEQAELPREEKPVVYLADLVRYREDRDEQYALMRELCARHGLRAVTPCDWAEGQKETFCYNPYAKAGNLAENYHQLIRGCDAVIADLNHYKGYECSNDVSFECGVGFELNKKLFGYMNDVRPCIEKIPHLGEKAGFRDGNGCSVENFNYPVNLMFGSSMEILEGKFQDVVEKIAGCLVKDQKEK